MLRTVLLERGVPGGELLNTEWIDDYPGSSTSWAGSWRRSMTDHARSSGPTSGRRHVEAIARRDGRHVRGRHDLRDEVYEAPAVILTAGGTPTKLGIPGELEYAGRGVSYCAVCDGAFFKGETSRWWAGATPRWRRRTTSPATPRRCTSSTGGTSSARRQDPPGAAVRRTRKIEVDLEQAGAEEVLGDPLTGMTGRCGCADTVSGETYVARGQRAVRLHRLPAQHRLVMPTTSSTMRRDT